ncbi:hypothetical protein [Streptomyces sp. NPDC059743]|uniref:hypothetical protein n=1 Tax=Streptomyces sp. NPDC059743 TaxID=3346928 RepID=UPI003649CD99
MLEFVSTPAEGLPPLDMAAYAYLLGPEVAAVIYVPAVTVQEVDIDGSLVENDVLLKQARRIGWVPTDDFAGWAEPSPGWSATLSGNSFTVRQPDNLFWYDGSLPASAQWRDTARALGRVFHFTATHGDAPRVIEQIGSAQALAIVTPYAEPTG